jgi:hypothetical protein
MRLHEIESGVYRDKGIVDVEPAPKPKLRDPMDEKPRKKKRKKHK